MRRFTHRWTTIAQACEFISAHHRHHQPPQGAIAAMALYEADRLIGVATIGRPVARLLGGTNTAEITRLCVLPDVPHAASALLARVKRLAQAWGFDRVVTYTLPSEGGASLRAAGMAPDIVSRGGSHSRPSRPRQDKHPLGPKQRWTA